MRLSVHGVFLLLFLQYKFINGNFEYTIHRLFNKKLICLCLRLHSLIRMILSNYKITSHKQKGVIILEKICLFYGFLQKNIRIFRKEANENVKEIF